MSSPQRFLNGMVNRAASDPMGQLLFPDPTIAHIFFDDFNRYAAADWVITTVETGAATEVIQDEDGGVLKLTNGTADNDSDMLQLSGDGGTTAMEIFALEVGKKAWFKTRCKINDKTESEFIIGIINADTTPLDASDGIFFIKADDIATLDFKAVKASVASVASSIKTMVDDTYVELAFYYDGKDTISYYVDGNLEGTLAADTLPTTELTVTFGVKNGTGAAKEFSIDYIFVAKQR